MDNNKIFVKDGYYIILKKEDDEILEHFIERGQFLVSQKEKDLNEIKKINTYSKIWINIKYLNCSYDNAIVNQLNKYLKKVNLSSCI